MMKKSAYILAFKFQETIERFESCKKSKNIATLPILDISLIKDYLSKKINYLK